MDEFTLAQVNQFVLRRQHLTADSRTDDVVQIALDIAGLHATGSAEPYIAAFARSRHFVREDLANALNITRFLVKVRYVRATLYILPSEMVPVAHAALRAKNQNNSCRYAQFMGVSDRDYRRVFPRVLEVLKGKALKASEIKSLLGEDLHFPSLLNLMCDEGLLLRVHSAGGREPRNYRFAIFKECLPDVNLDAYTEEEAVVRLLRAHLSAFGPATVEDIVWWTGLTRAHINRALEGLGSQVTAVGVAGLAENCLMLGENVAQLEQTRPATVQTINLLPNLDPYLMGYKLRTRYLDAGHYHYIFDRSGNATATILLDGRVIGVWDISDRTVMKLFFFKRPEKVLVKQVEVEADRMARFIIGKEVEIRHVSAMTSLTQRTAGGFMSPLKGAQE